PVPFDFSVFILASISGRGPLAGGNSKAQQGEPPQCITGVLSSTFLDLPLSKTLPLLGLW
ncbi:hypothetical protein, partial [Vibrio parahaemolyticus]|uniref:hypothetical protein n=1 Tax=Vibrio parahaemolyticus TaxID=670 RepID=UPI001BB068B6